MSYFGIVKQQERGLMSLGIEKIGYIKILMTADGGYLFGRAPYGGIDDRLRQISVRTGTYKVD
ncbi:hypothetical protein V7122_09890 [Bacillus sp. JJ1532]|uniref:hypothetical protein n=1 Tax=Bacillus sp. JJ1532 TaxID=3122958 RepID=UPI002FFFCE75